MPDEKKPEEELERLAVVMVARRDQLKMAEKITDLEKRIKHLESIERLFFDHIHLGNKQHHQPKTRREPCKTRSRSK